MLRASKWIGWRTTAWLLHLQRHEVGSWGILEKLMNHMVRQTSSVEGSLGVGTLGIIEGQLLLLSPRRPSSRLVEGSTQRCWIQTVSKAVRALLKDLRLESATKELHVISLKSFFIHFIIIFSFLVMQACCDVFCSLVGSSLGQLSRIWIKLRFKHLLGLILQGLCLGSSRTWALAVD